MVKRQGKVRKEKNSWWMWSKYTTYLCEILKQLKLYYKTAMDYLNQNCGTH